MNQIRVKVTRLTCIAMSGTSFLPDKMRLWNVGNTGKIGRPKDPKATCLSVRNHEAQLSLPTPPLQGGFGCGAWAFEPIRKPGLTKPIRGQFSTAIDVCNLTQRVPEEMPEGATPNFYSNLLT